MPANPDRFLRLSAVLAQTGLCRSTLYRKMADGTFPRSTQLSTRCIGWRASAIDEWMRNPVSYDPAKGRHHHMAGVASPTLACETCP